MDVKLEPPDEIKELAPDTDYFCSTTLSVTNQKIKDEIPQIPENISSIPELEAELLLDDKNKTQMTIPHPQIDSRIGKLFPSVPRLSSVLTYVPKQVQIISRTLLKPTAAKNNSQISVSDKDRVLKRPVPDKIYSTRVTKRVFEPANLLLGRFLKKKNADDRHPPSEYKDDTTGLGDKPSISEPANLLYDQFRRKTEDSDEVDSTDSENSVGSHTKEEMNEISMGTDSKHKLHEKTGHNMLYFLPDDENHTSDTEDIIIFSKSFEQRYPIGKKGQWSVALDGRKKMRENGWLEKLTLNPRNEDLTSSKLEKTQRDEEVAVPEHYPVGRKLNTNVRAVLSDSPPLKPTKKRHRVGIPTDVQTVVLKPSDFNIGAVFGKLDLSCPICQKEFTEVDFFLKHIRKSPLELFYRCKSCSKYFYNEEKLLSHVQTHETAFESDDAASIFTIFPVESFFHRDQKCLLCPNCTRYITCLPSYFVSHLNDRRFEWMSCCDPSNKIILKCQYCSAVFTTEGTLKEHLYVKHRKRKKFCMSGSIDYAYNEFFSS